MAAPKPRFAAFAPVSRAELDALFEDIAWNDEALQAMRALAEPFGASPRDTTVLHDERWPGHRFCWWSVRVPKDGKRVKREVVLGHDVTYPDTSICALSDWLGWSVRRRQAGFPLSRLLLFRQLADSHLYPDLLTALDLMPGALTLVPEPEPDWDIDVDDWIQRVVTMARAITQPTSSERAQPPRAE